MLLPIFLQRLKQWLSRGVASNDNSAFNSEATHYSAQADQTRHEYQPTQGLPDYTPKPDLSLQAASMEAILLFLPGSMKMTPLRL